MSPKLKILFLCTGNSCRSQMAEGWAKALKGDVIEAYSAGIETHGLNASAVKVMAEAGVDISGHQSKNVSSLMDVPFDYVVTVCGHANETCPMFPGKAKSCTWPLTTRRDSPGRPRASRRQWTVTAACGTKFGRLSRRCRNR